MTTHSQELDGSPCQFHKTLGGTIMTCVQIDCDGVHHYLVGS